MANLDGSNGVRDVEVVAKPKRRRFSKEYKLKVLTDVEAAEVGGISAILRREGLYSSHLDQWRKERARGELTGRAPGRKPGRPRKENKPLVDENMAIASNAVTSRASAAPNARWRYRSGGDSRRP